MKYGNILSNILSTGIKSYVRVSVIKDMKDIALEGKATFIKGKWQIISKIFIMPHIMFNAVDL